MILYIFQFKYLFHHQKGNNSSVATTYLSMSDESRQTFIASWSKYFIDSWLWFIFCVQNPRKMLLKITKWFLSHNSVANFVKTYDSSFALQLHENTYAFYICFILALSLYNQQNKTLRQSKVLLTSVSIFSKNAADWVATPLSTVPPPQSKGWYDFWAIPRQSMEQNLSTIHLLQATWCPQHSLK